MATKKKRRIKRKKSNIRNEVALDFNIKKKEYGSDVYINKQILYSVKTNEEIETELRNHSINLNEKDILDRYQKEYDFEKLCDYYYRIFEEQISSLNRMNILLDEDCVLFYTDKVIKSHYQINQIPDPGYIVESLSLFSDLLDEEKPEYMLNILNSIFHLKDYRKSNDLIELFSNQYYDVSGFLCEAIGIDIHNCHLDVQKAQSICHVLYNILDYYDIDESDSLYSLGLGLLAQNGYNAVEDAFLNGLNKYPESHMKIYNSVISELALFGDDHNHFKDIQRLYQEAMRLPINNQEDKEYLEYIKQYEYEIK